MKIKRHLFKKTLPPDPLQGLFTVEKIYVYIEAMKYKETRNKRLSH